jgi:iron complex transport system permease protein
MTTRRLPAGPTTLALGLLLLAVLVLAASLGEVALSPPSVARAVLHPALPFVPSADELTAGIVWDLRLPRVLLAALVGAALSIAGVSLQGLLGNPLADPYTIGVSSGAAVGAGAAILLGIGSAWAGLALPLMAFGAALATMLLVFSLARVGGTLHTASFLLAGIIAGSFLWSLMTLPKIALLAPLTLSGTALFMICGRGLDAFSFGEDTARSVGVEVEKFKAGILALAALLTAASVSVSGIIGFVGLVVPHLARGLVGPPHRALVPVAALLGATLTVLADLLARMLLRGQEIPVGVVTALIGAPFFCLLLRRQMGR